MKLSSLLILFVAMTAHGSVTLSPLFGDHAVLQRDHPIPVWGQAEPGEAISVELAGHQASTKADALGHWETTLPAMPAGGPWTLTVRGQSCAKSEDIMIGEVWLCAGQSNMELSLRESADAEREIRESKGRRIRHFKVPHVLAAEPRKTLPPASWDLADPKKAGSFTALGYHFAKLLEQDQDVTIGLVNSSWGGTYLEAWISREAMLREAAHKHIPTLSEAALERFYTGAERSYASTLCQLGLSNGNMSEKPDLWISSEFDDSKWLDIRLPGAWEDSVLPGFDGVAWFRKRFTLPPGFSSSGCVMRLGKIQDVDTCYLNGVLLGQNMAEAPSSSYAVPPTLLHEGENVLTVRVENYWEQGGFTGHPQDLALTGPGGARLGLNGVWKMNLGAFHGSWIRSPNVHPNLLFNGMVLPLAPFSFRGVLWYQGESNDIFAGQYRDMLGRLIDDWRRVWHNSELPFLLVQLPNHRPFDYKILPPGSRWALIREAQASASQIPLVDFAVAIDLGDTQEIHPKDKRELARRLALLARAKVYRQAVRSQAPQFRSFKILGNCLQVFLTDTGEALVCKAADGLPRGFEIAGEDRVFHPAEAKLEGQFLTVSSPRVSKPVALRYAWTDDPRVDLYTKSGLPVAPFRTDNWPTGAEGKAFDRQLTTTEDSR